MAKKKSKQNKAAAKHIGVKVWDEVKTPLLIMSGLAGGVLAGKAIDKYVVKPNATATGFQVKSLVKPAVQLAAGIGGHILSKNEYVKLVATGVAVSGILSTTKVILKKDILQGLSEMAGLGATDEVKRVFREPVNITIEPYNPDLPRLPRAQIAATDNTLDSGSDTDAEILGESDDEDISFV